MKKLFLLMLGLTMIFAACDKEKDDDDPNKKDDVFKEITASKQQEAYVLLTTATWCGYCGDWGIPTFDAAFAGEDGIDKNRVNGMSLHYSSSDPMYLEMSKTLKDAFGIGGPPNLWIEFNNAYNLQPGGWKSAVKQRQNGPDAPCGIGMKVTKTGDEFTVYAKVQFFSAMSGSYNIAVYATEDGIVANQSGSSAGANHIHKEVLRGEITANAAYGTSMFSGASPEEYHGTFTWTPTPGIDPANLKFVAVVYEMNGASPVASPNSNTIKAQ